MSSSLLVVALLAVGQTAEPAPPTPKPPADRWLLMQSLQGTYQGWLLDSQRIQVTGWTEGCYTAGTARSNNLPMGFNYLDNQFALQQNWLRIDRPVVKDGTTEPTFGFRSDTILPGTDYRFTMARGLFSGQLTENDGMPNTYGVDPVQFFGEAYFPTIGRGLDIKVGRIFCQYGVEAIDTVSNVLASHAYTFIYDPFTHTGVVAALQLTPEWSMQIGAVMGSDVFIDPAASPYGMFAMKWAPPSGRNSVQLSGILGSGHYNRAEEFNNPNIIDFVAVHSFNSRLSYTFNGLAGWETGVPDIGTATWFGLVQYLTCKVSPRASCTARLEFFDDIDGNRTGYKGLYSAVTTGVNVAVTRSVILRPELRYDYNNESRPFQDQHGLFTAAADFILRW